MERESEIGYIIAMVIMLGLAIIVIGCIWRVFVKAGQPGWAAIIPIYNLYTMVKIGGKPGYWTLLCFIPYLNLVFLVWIFNMISKSFGKDEGFTIGLFFLWFIFWPILGYSNSKYLGPYGDPAAFAASQGKFRFDFEQPQQP